MKQTDVIMIETSDKTKNIQFNYLYILILRTIIIFNFPEKF